MFQKLKLTILSLSTIFTFALMAAVPLAVNAQSAQDTTINNGLCSGSTLSVDSNAGSCSSTSDSTSRVNTFITNAINVFSIIVGLIAVIMIIVGGLRYVTSGGDSTQVTNAKNTILYAIIGLVIVALAQFIVRFVLNKATSSTAA